MSQTPMTHFLLVSSNYLQEPDRAPLTLTYFSIHSYLVFLDELEIFIAILYA